MSANKNTETTIDISTLDPDALRDLQKRIASRMAKETAKELESLRNEYAVLMQRITEAAAPYGLTPRKLLASTPAQVLQALESSADEAPAAAPRRRKRSAVEPKYRNPSNAAQTWSGRGNRPAWVTQWLAKHPNGKMTDLLTKRPRR